MLSVDFLIWVVLLRNQLMSGGFCPLKSKLGGYAPEWVAMLRNRAAPEGRFGGKITTLGGFAPENSTVPKPPKLGGHAPEHPLNIVLHFSNKIHGAKLHFFHFCLKIDTCHTFALFTFAEGDACFEAYQHAAVLISDEVAI